MGRVVVIGAGVSGLRCAGVLHEAGREVLLLEREDRVGGRVRTDRRDGFLLDRGFQVLPTGYREARACLDFDGLDLHPFRSGALVRADGGFHALHHPLRHPSRAWESLTAPVGSLADRVRLGWWAARLLAGGPEAAWRGPAETARSRLRRLGFSSEMVGRFLRPFFAGIFLERDLVTSARMMSFVLASFARGPAALPAAGMEAIPRQLAARLPEGAVRTGAPVAAVDPDGTGVELDGGGRLRADAVVVAVDPWSASRLLPDRSPPEARGVTGLYFAADRAPVAEPLLVLNGEAAGPVNHLAVLSRVCPTYAPPGLELIAANVVEGADREDEELESAARTQLRGWFGSVVERWRCLRVDRRRRALPVVEPRPGGADERPLRLGHALYQCGDAREHPSLEGALVSGRRAAEALLAEG